MKTIPVYEPLFNGNEKKYLNQAIDSGWVSSDGYFVQKFEEEFAKWSCNKYAVAVCNGTAALETAIYSLDLPKCSILIPDSTIISCALAVLRNNKSICLHDHSIFDKDDKPTAFTMPYTAAVMQCHLFGHYLPVETDLNIIDDCSQFWEPFCVSDVGCYSLYANKLITSGEGGILVTNQKSTYIRAKEYRNLCHSKERFVHNDLGYNLRMSNIQAAVALAQLEQIDKFIEIKQSNAALYLNYLPDYVDILFDVRVPWMYLISTNQDAGKVVKTLKEKYGIDCRRNFYPLHRQPCFDEKYKYTDFPKADLLWKSSFYLPSGLTLTEKEIQYICKSLRTTLGSTT